MAGYIQKPSNEKTTWDVENETYEEFKARRDYGTKSISQPNSVKRQQGDCKVTGVPKENVSAELV